MARSFNRLSSLIVLATTLALVTQYCSCDGIIDKKIEVFKELLEQIRRSKPTSKSAKQLSDLFTYKRGGSDHAEHIGSFQDLQKRKNEVRTRNVTNSESLLPSNQFTTFKPFEHCQNLKYGMNSQGIDLNYEHNEKTQIKGVRVVAHVGFKKDNTVYYFGVYGYSSVQLLQQYNSTSKRTCKKVLFVKKCKTRTIKTEKALTPQQNDMVNDFLLEKAFWKIEGMLNFFIKISEGTQKQLIFGKPMDPLGLLITPGIGILGKLLQN